MAELNVSRKNINDLFIGMQNKRFVIPYYQRPYKWDIEKCEILWEDIVLFYEDSNKDEEYFLGTIVTCKSNTSDLEIIDGQQRITTILLLLRAFYEHLEGMPPDKNVDGLKKQIEPCIWDIHPISGLVDDKGNIHIESKVATEIDNGIFHKILFSGSKGIDGNETLYFQNYKYFLEQSKEYAKDKPMKWYELCVSILKKCIILPIECENLNTGLTIFSTLNDRGMSLSDSDIFKAQIYKNKKDSNEEEEFVQKWKELSEEVIKAKISLDDIFRYYSHIIRAKNNISTKEIALRTFYSKDNYKIFKEDKDIIDNLIDIAKFWTDINSIFIKPDNIQLKFEEKKYLHCLFLYPNDYWRYIVSVFYFKNKNLDIFSRDFSNFLKALLSFLFIKFLEKPTVNYIKDSIFKACIEVWERKYPTVFKDIVISHEKLKEDISNGKKSKIAKALILLKAYLNKSQSKLIDSNFDVEHILPKKWQSANYNGWNKADADEYLEKLGNKVTLEKKLNIQAGKGYFGEKKGKYKNSSIQDVLDLSEYKKDDWEKEDIEEREKFFVDEIFSFFQKSINL